MTTISLVVPTYEMSGYLPELWASFESAGLFDVLEEVIVVDDGSKDATREVLARLAGGAHGEKLVRVHLERNVGRFRARIEGAKRAKGSHVLFLDSRLTLPQGFGRALAVAAEKHASVMGVVDIDVTRNVFCLYWDRSHRRIFRRTYEATKRELVLTPDNYDDHVKGTTVFLCERDTFLETSSAFEDLLNDDTFLLKEMVKKTPITIDPTVRVQWVPRETFREFLERLWERGPSFVEYHVFEHQGAFFWAVVAGGVVFVGLSCLTLAAPFVGGIAWTGALAATALSTALFARSPVELVKLAPLHVAVVGTFGAGVLRGLWVNARRAAFGRGPRAAAAAVARPT